MSGQYAFMLSADKLHIRIEFVIEKNGNISNINTILM